MTDRTVSTVVSASSTAAAESHDPVRLKQAFEAKRGELEAMPAESLVENPGLEAGAASSIVIGAISRIEPHLPAIVAHYGAAGEALVLGLLTVALATEQANVEVAAAESSSDLREGHEELMAIHQLLETDLDAAANRKLVDRSRIDAGRGKLGQRTVVMSVLVLVALAREVWSKIEGKTGLTKADVDAAEAHAQEQLTRLNQREQGVTRMHAMEMRRRAINLLIRHYGEVRRMITYIRWWEGDADVIAPSLWSGRRRRRPDGADEDEVVVAPTPVTPPTPSPGPTDQGGPFTS